MNVNSIRLFTILYYSVFYPDIISISTSLKTFSIPTVKNTQYS